MGSTSVTTDASGDATFSPSVPVQAAPGSVVTATATQTDADTGTSEFSACRTVTATTLGADISVTPASVSFGSQPVGTNSGTQAVTIANTGAADLQVAAPSESSSHFEISTDNCGPTYPRTLTLGQSCTLSVRFTPQAAGSQTTNLTISSDDPDEATVNVELSGTGTVPEAALDPTSVGFGNQAVGVASSPATVTISNTGTATLAVSSISVVGANAGDFAVSTNACSPLPRNLSPAGGSCSVSVTFTPTATGSREAALRFATNDSDSPHDVQLSGNGTTPPPGDIDLTPSSINFGNVPVGTDSTPSTVTIQNTGTGPLQISAPVVGNSAFSISTDNCGPTYPRTIAPSSSCTLDVRFSPVSANLVNSNLTISSNDPDESSVQVGLSGDGTTPADIAFDPTSLSFGSHTVGVPSTPQIVEISNVGETSLNVTSIGKAGSHPGDFTLDAADCGAPPFILIKDAACDVSVTFTAGAVGSRSATMRVTSSDPADATSDVSLGGTGTPAPSPLPDALIRRSKDSVSIGNDIYEDPPLTQVVSWTAKRKQSRTFVLEFQNDGAASGPVTVQGCASTSKFVVKYLAAGADMTPAVTAGTYATGSLSPAGSAAIDLVITPKKASTTLACNVTATAASQSDTVQARLKAKR